MANESAPVLSEVQQQQFKDIDAAFAARDFDRVGQICREMDAADPFNPLILRKCADSFFPQGKMMVASQYFRRVLEIVPNDVEAHFKLGLVWYSQEKWQDADREFSKVLALQPGHAGGLEWRNRVANALAGKIPESERPHITTSPSVK